SSGSYDDEATGDRVTLDGHELTLLLPAYKSGAKVSDVRVTPVSTWAAALTGFHVRKLGQDVASADSDAWSHLDAHLGDIDWRAATPGALTDATTLSPDVRASLLLAALSAQARAYAEAAGSPSDAVVNGATLSEALATDALD